MISYTHMAALNGDAARTRLLEILRHLSFRYSEKEEFLLVSGRRSRYYFDCKPALSSAEARFLAGQLIFNQVRDLPLVAVGGMAVGAIPIANAVSDAAFRIEGKDLRTFFVRKTVKEHGTKKSVEGDVRPGTKVLIVEDVITTGQSTIDAILAARDFGLDIVKVIALIDREESDGRQNIEKLGMTCESIFTVRDFS